MLGLDFVVDFVVALMERVNRRKRRLAFRLPLLIVVL